MEPDTPRNQENHRIKCWSPRLGNHLTRTQPPGSHVVGRRWHEVSPAKLAHHEMPVFPTEDAPQEQVTDIFRVLRAKDTSWIAGKAMLLQPVIRLAPVLEGKPKKECVLRRCLRLPELFSSLQPSLSNEHRRVG
jgi:hypothetical protein